MLHLAVRLALAAVLLGAAAAKLRRPRESAEALRGLLAPPAARTRSASEGARASATGGRGSAEGAHGSAPDRRGSAGGSHRSARDGRDSAVGPSGSVATLGAVVAAEVLLAGGVAAGLDVAALAAAVFLLAGALLLARALRAGRGGAPCGCFGARSRITRGAVARAALLAAAFAALPLVPRTDPSAEAWLAIGLGVALLAIAALGLAVLALAREVGMLRLAVGPQGALEVAGEGPELGADSGLGPHLDPRLDDGFALVVFTSEGCGMCRRLGPGIQALARHPHVSLLELDEVEDAAHWRRLNVPGSPYALALDGGGRVLAKGTFNSLAQLESVLAAAERRRAEAAGV